MLLRVEKGSFYYTSDTPILQDITLSLEKGEVIAVMGPNGIGKTTFLKCLMGIYKWKSGHSLIDGKDTGNARKQIGYVPQAHRFSFPYSVGIWLCLAEQSICLHLHHQEKWIMSLLTEPWKR